MTTEVSKQKELSKFRQVANTLGGPTIVTFIGAVLAAVGAFSQPMLALVGGTIAAFGAVLASKDQNKSSQKIESKNEEIVRLTKEVAYSVTGGPAVCYLVPLGNAPQTTMAIVSHGDYPLYEVNARVVDLDLMESKTPSTSYLDLSREETTLSLGNLPPKAAHMRPSVFKMHGDYRRWNIFFSARNGFFTQCLRARLIDGNWISASQVTRQSSGNLAPEMVLEQIPDNFPREKDGSFRWH